MDCLIDFTVADAELKERFRNSLDVKWNKKSISEVDNIIA